MIKKRFLSMLVLLAAVATGAVAQNYTITLPSVSNGSVSAKVNDASVTSAEAGATVSLVATPYAGYRLKTISGTYQGAPEETFQKGAAMREGTYFRLVASANNNAGWRFNTGSESTITITSKQEGTLIDKVELSITTGVSFNFNTISVSSGTKTINGNVITITGINNTTLTITGTGNAAQGCTVQSATITGTGTVDKALSLTSTGDDNVKTFTMPSGNVTVSAEFEEIPAVDLTANEGATGEYWATFYSNAMNYQAPEGTQMFKVALAGSAITMTEITDRIVKKDQGVVLKKTASGSITMTPTSSNSSDDYSGNSLVGTMTSITNPGNAYVLNYKAATGAGFYKLSSGGTIGANKAYLVSGAGAPEFFSFDGNTTSINEVRGKMEDVSGEYYDLQGRRVSQPTKGLYIVNGKKVFINK